MTKQLEAGNQRLSEAGERRKKKLDNRLKGNDPPQSASGNAAAASSRIPRDEQGRPADEGGGGLPGAKIEFEQITQYNKGIKDEMIKGRKAVKI